MSDSIQPTLDASTLPTAVAAEPRRVPATALTAARGDSSIPRIAYRGAETVAEFSSTRDELAALLTGAGVYDLGWRSFFRCAGRDRVRWLNGMVTNSVKGLEENSGCYAFVLNAQGRIQGELNIFRPAQAQEFLWLDIERAQLESLSTFLRRYIIMDQVALEPEEGWSAIGIAGPEAAAKLRALSLAVAEGGSMRLSEAVWQGHAVVVVAAFSPLVPRYEIWIESAAAPALWNAVTDAGAVPTGANAVEQLRILEGIPAYGVDLGDRDLPQETGQTRALNFTKGCYLGQEIVERIRSRGSVHRTLSGFLIEGELPACKTPILSEDKPVGELTSVARVAIPGVGDRGVALGFIRREALDANTILTAGGSQVTASALPFDFIVPAAEP